MKKLSFPALLFCLLLPMGLRADVTIVSETETGGMKMESTMRVAGGKMQMSMGPGSVILLPAENKMVILLEAQQAYMVRRLDAAASTTPETVAPVITRTGKKETINGFACEQVLVKLGDDSAELWVSEQGPDLGELLPVLEALQRQGKSRMDPAWTKFMTQDKDLRKYPIRLIAYGKGGVEQARTTVKSINKEPLPSALFEIPDGFTEMKIPGFPP